MAKPKFLLINWSVGSVVGAADTESELFEKAEKLKQDYFTDALIIAEVRHLSETKRVWS